MGALPNGFSQNRRPLTPPERCRFRRPATGSAGDKFGTYSRAMAWALKRSSKRERIEGRNSSSSSRGRRGRLVDRVHHKAGEAVFQDFRHRTAARRRSPACRRPSPRSSPGRTARASRWETAAREALPRNSCFWLSSISPMNSTCGTFGQQGLGPPARNRPGRPDRPWRRFSAVIPAWRRSRWPRPAPCRGRCGPGKRGSRPRPSPSRNCRSGRP